MARAKRRTLDVESEPFTPLPGWRYWGRFGGRFQCERLIAPGEVLMRDINTDCIFRACECRIYGDGTVCWDHQEGAHYERR